jgi:nucleotide-binding universal stress UspA family protein
VSTIVIGVEDSAHSEDAVAFGRLLAGATTGRVVVACAFPYSDVPSRAANRAYRDVLEREASRTARRMSERLEGVAPERIHAVTVAHPSSAHALHSLAESEHAAIVVVGSTHTGTLGRVLPGATGERLLHGSPCAVAVVPSGYRTRPHPAINAIGAAFDGSKEAAVAVETATAIAGAPDPAYGAGELMGGSADPALRDELRHVLRGALDAAVAGIRADVPAEPVLLEGDPAEQLIERTADLDLLVTGSRGYGPLRAVLVGGVSGRLTRAARCPVIITPRGLEAPPPELFAVGARTPSGPSARRGSPSA